MTNKTNGIMKVLNNKSTGKWYQPCEITIRLNDIDHAYAITADNRLLGDNEYCSGYNQALRGCEKQITSAGYKVE